MSDTVFIQVVGIIASALVITAFSHRCDKRLKIIMLTGAMLFSCHFYFLGAYAAMVVNFINSFRIGLSIKFHNSNVVMACFILIYLAVGLLVYERPVDVLPIFSGCLGTFSMYKLSGIRLRLFLLVGSGPWLIYNTIFQSIGGIITELFIQATNTVTIFRLLKDKKVRTNDQDT